MSPCFTTPAARRQIVMLALFTIRKSRKGLPAPEGISPGIQLPKGGVGPRTLWDYCDVMNMLRHVLQCLLWRHKSILKTMHMYFIDGPLQPWNTKISCITLPAWYEYVIALRWVYSSRFTTPGIEEKSLLFLIIWQVIFSYE